MQEHSEMFTEKNVYKLFIEKIYTLFSTRKVQTCNFWSHSQQINCPKNSHSQSRNKCFQVEKLTRYIEPLLFK